MQRLISAIITFAVATISVVGIGGPSSGLDPDCADPSCASSRPMNGRPQMHLERKALLKGAWEFSVCGCMNSKQEVATKQPKPRHKLSAELGNENGRPIAYGKVTTFKGAYLRILRRVDHGRFDLFKTTRTHELNGTYKTFVKQAGDERTCFRVVAPATRKYRRTAAFIGCIG